MNEHFAGLSFDDIRRRITDELRQLPVDHLGGVEDGDEADEVAREHAVEQQVDLLGLQFDAGRLERRTNFALFLFDLGAVRPDTLKVFRDLRFDRIDGIRQDAGEVRLFRCDELFFLQLDVLVFDIANVMAQHIKLFLNVDDRRVGDDPERRVEKIAHLGVAVFSRFLPERRDDVVVAARKLARPGAGIGRVLEHGIHRRHQRLGLLILNIAVARVLGCSLGGGSRRTERIALDCWIDRRRRVGFARLQPVGDGVAFRRLRGGAGWNDHTCNKREA